MSVQSLIKELTSNDTIKSASALAAEHEVNLKTAINHLNKNGFLWDVNSWVKVSPMISEELGELSQPFPGKLTPRKYEGATLIIPTKLAARFKQIEQARQAAGLPNLLDRASAYYLANPDDELGLQSLAINWLMSQLDKLKLSWIEHNIVTAEGFMAASKKLPPLPPVPNYSPHLEPYEPHEPDDSEEEPHEPGYNHANY